ncbi:MAG TPA: CaiB/BaiF CoA-transferase family protein [Caulobacteraceae bacterium]|nr:CaiB/BaiF CoA-transferase family protein [Caulobacteraceae bacterium]
MGALAGITVVSLEQAVAAPLCTARLADAGARVIKVERPEGDFARGYDQAAKGQSSYFVWLNRGKESVALDLRQTDDLALLSAMIERADVFVQNLAPGAAGRLGFDPAELRKRHPRLITVSISGYGSEGSYRERKAYDLLVQAETGLASVTGRPEGPGRVGVSVCDIACGLNAHSAVLEALIARGATGQGRAIEVSLFDSLADWMTVPLLQYEASGVSPPRVGLHHVSIAPYGVYTCGDGASVLLAIQNEREWASFCAVVLGRSDVATDPRFSSNVARVENRDSLNGVVNAVFEGLDRAGLIERLERAKVAFGMLNDLSDLSNHPVLRRVAVETASGPVTIAPPPAVVDGETPRLGPVPAIDQHGAAIRAEFRKVPA